MVLKLYPSVSQLPLSNTRYSDGKSMHYESQAALLSLLSLLPNVEVVVVTSPTMHEPCNLSRVVQVTKLCDVAESRLAKLLFQIAYSKGFML
mmetsp:Transcript_41553/g.100053  ORF Transcript_41553/g.100053 Transcript_41553/m.100053 type:complete len:92 (-) Transcript_41553:301-576(-)